MKEGDHFEERFTVTEEIYNGFRTTFNDNNPLHTDPGFAEEKGFKDIVMHGNILNGFISYFIGECLPEKNVIIHQQDIKFAKPVYLNDHLLFTAVIDEIYDSVGTVVFKYSFENAESVKVASGKIQIGRIK